MMMTGFFEQHVVIHPDLLVLYSGNYTMLEQQPPPPPFMPPMYPMYPPPMLGPGGRPMPPPPWMHDVCIVLYLYVDGQCNAHTIGK